MPSATDFLPSSMTEFMNLVRTTSPKRGSGRTSRFSGRRRRDIGRFSFSLQPDPPRRRGLLRGGLFGPLGAVFGTGLAAVLDPLGVEHAAKHVVADARKVANAATADQHDAVLLEVVALAGNVADHLALVGQADLGHLPQRRVRLLRGRRVDAGADSALLRVLLHRRDLGLGLLRLATLADQLVDRRHEALHFLKLLYRCAENAKARAASQPPGPCDATAMFKLLPAPGTRGSAGEAAYSGERHRGQRERL